MAAVALQVGEALPAALALHAQGLTLSAAPVLDTPRLALATFAAFHALSLTISAATLHLG